MRRLPPSLALLFLAWFCAQQPQSFVVDVVTWVRGAGRFSHQQNLAIAVRVALARAAKTEATMVAAETQRPAPPRSLPVPEVVLCKVPLLLVSGLDVLPPPQERVRFHETGLGWETRARDVPVPVPRAPGSAVL